MKFLEQGYMKSIWIMDRRVAILECQERSGSTVGEKHVPGKIFDEKLSAFYDTFSYHCNEVFTMRIVNRKDNNKKWFSTEIKEMHGILCGMKKNVK